MAISVYGTRNVPMKSFAELHSRRIQGKQDLASYQEHHEREQQKHTAYQREEMSQLVEAESVENVEDVLDGLVNRKIEIQKSNLRQEKKQQSIQQLQEIETLCDAKIRQLRSESKLQKKIQKAKEDGDGELLQQLTKEYTREKTIRKNHEYTTLRNNIYQNKSKVYMYSSNQNGVDLYREQLMNASMPNIVSSCI